jgi:mono/diheme cytochrome c family protein
MSAHRLAWLCLAALLVAGPARAADAADGSFQSVTRFMERNGEAVFVHVCAGCHMPDAKGAVGAARYPALAQDAKLGIASYAVLMVTNGRAGMPSFARLLDDDQIAGVVNYVRTHFGNDYKDAVTQADVKAARP